MTTYDSAEMARRARIGNALKTPEKLAEEAQHLRDYWETTRGNGKATGAKGSLERYLSARYRLNDRGCWEWTMSTAGGSYGYFMWKGLWLYAHRASWQVWRGPIPEDMNVCHHCDNPLCYNPDHLFLGTQSDNLKFFFLKRRRPPRGNRNAI